MNATSSQAIEIGPSGHVEVSGRCRIVKVEALDGNGFVQKVGASIDGAPEEPHAELVGVILEPGATLDVPKAEGRRGWLHVEPLPPT